MAVSGKWEGKLLDASGPIARVTAALKQSKQKVAGDFSVYLGTARDCCAPSWKLVQTAPVSGMSWLIESAASPVPGGRSTTR